MRVGLGYDSHAFSVGDHLMIGGVKVPFYYGVRSHSDGDVLLHAVIDALLGASALGDIGHHFPDTDPQYKSISSQVMLQQVLAQIQQQNYQVQNMDATIITELPKLAEYIPLMKTNLVELLQTPHISIKAKTNEKMGCIGRGEGLVAQAVVLLAPK